MSSVWVKNFWSKKNESFFPQNVFPPLYKFFTPTERPINHFEVGMRDQKSWKSDSGHIDRASGFHFSAPGLNQKSLKNRFFEFLIVFKLHQNEFNVGKKLLE